MPGSPPHRRRRMTGCPNRCTALQDCLPHPDLEGSRVKFRVDRDAFADAVAWAARSLPVRPSAPVLSGLLIDASDEGLVLSTFDYETSARADLTAQVLSLIHI